MIVGCKEEFDQQSPKYQYLWPFTSNCGGYHVIAVPNTFSPNQDGINDTWYVGSSVHYYADSCNGSSTMQLPHEVKSFSLEVRDIHNELYFSTPNINAHWDGQKNNTYLLASPGQYLWKFRLEDLDGVVHEEHGTLNVMM